MATTFQLEGRHAAANACACLRIVLSAAISLAVLQFKTLGGFLQPIAHQLGGQQRLDEPGRVRGSLMLLITMTRVSGLHCAGKRSWQQTARSCLQIRSGIKNIP